MKDAHRYLPSSSTALRLAAPAAALALVGALTAGCGGDSRLRAEASHTAGAPTVGVAKVTRKALSRDLTVSSELVPFQEIDVYAKESGYVKQLLVDYGSHVKAGQLLAVLEIPELEAQLQQDEAAVANANDRVTTAQHDLRRVQAQHRVAHLQYERLAGVAKTQAGLVAQQEIDDAQGKDLAAEAADEAAQSNLQGAQSALQAAEANRQRDRVLFGYSRITAPFAGIVTQRFANLGTLLQAGTNSSTQAMPLVRLSQDDRFRLVIPVPESYVKYVQTGDPVKVNIPSLGQTFPGEVTRFSYDVQADTRTMHTEVDVKNPDHVLVPGMYAEATLALDRKADSLAVPLQAVTRTNDATSVLIVNGNKVEERKVSLGLETASDAEVLSGLHDGDLVVVSDRGGLKAGETVHAQPVNLIDYTATSK